MPQTGPDLVSGGYPISRPLLSLLGATTNVAQANIPARTNLDYPLGSLVDGTAAASGVALTVPCPVVPGDVITKVSVLVGATAASVPTHSVVALYAGTGSAPALIAQSTDTGSAAIAASGVKSFSLTTPQTITSAQAPYGFIYVSLIFAGTTIATCVSGTTATAAYYQWYANGPLFVAASHGSALTDTAPATIASTTPVAKAPVVVLT